MRLLILGGTAFLGRHTVEAARACGHEVTLFHRGKTNPGLFASAPDVEEIFGDRKETLEALKGRTWDAAIDTCGYVPRAVRMSAEALAGVVDHYTFISTISVYKDYHTPGMDEEYPLAKTEGMEDTEEVTGDTYGPLKVLCEQAAEAAMPGRVLTIRPGLIIGPHDPSDRFTDWPVRVARGGDVAAPAPPEQPVQVIDARDLAEWSIRLIEQGKTGFYNAVGPDYALSFTRLLETCRDVAGSDARFVWMDETFLLSQGVQPWTEMTLWVPPSEGVGFNTVSVAKAIYDGLTFRPIADTVRDTLTWERTRPSDTPRRAGLPTEKETAILRAWQEQTSKG